MTSIQNIHECTWLHHNICGMDSQRRYEICLMNFCNCDPLFQIVNETIPALQTLKATGKVRHIGLSGLPLKIFRWVGYRIPSHS